MQAIISHSHIVKFSEKYASHLYVCMQDNTLYHEEVLYSVTKIIAEKTKWKGERKGELVLHRSIGHILSQFNTLHRSICHVLP